MSLFVSTIKEKVNSSIRHHTHRGFIGWSDCDSICLDMHECLEMCAKPWEEGEYLAALEAVVVILVSGVKLASYADSSSGMLTDVVLLSLDMVREYTEFLVDQDKEISEKAFSMILKESRKRAFRGWTDWQYQLLRCAVCLCDEKRARRLEKLFDTLLEQEEDRYGKDVRKQEDAAARYFLHRHLWGKDAVREELYANIGVRELCQIAIRDAMEAGDFREAEKLCRRKLGKEDSWSYRSSDPEDWNNILFQVYQASGNTKKQIAQAKKLLLYGNEHFWDVLKQLYQQQGMWEEKCQELLDDLKNSGRLICYRSILVEEKETKRLLDDLQAHPFDIFTYGSYLAQDYPEELFALCRQFVTTHCAQASNRREYRKVAKEIAQMVSWGGSSVAEELVDELKRTYSRKYALLDELEDVEFS